MQAIVPGVALAILSGLTFLAYKHPEAFARMYIVLQGLAALAIYTMLVWQLASSEGYLSIYRYVLDAGKGAEAEKAFKSLRVSDWAFGSAVACVAYFSFLRHGLPWLIGHDEKPPKPKRGKKD